MKNKEGEEEEKKRLNLRNQKQFTPPAAWLPSPPAAPPFQALSPGSRGEICPDPSGQEWIAEPEAKCIPVSRSGVFTYL